MRNREYIRGWRQITAIYWSLMCLFTGNWRGCLRELFIITGFARYYKIDFAPSFWKSYKETLNLTNGEFEKQKSALIEEFGEYEKDKDKTD